MGNHTGTHSFIPYHYLDRKKEQREMDTRERRIIPRWQIDRQVKVMLEGALTHADCTVCDLSFKGAKISLAQKLEKDTFLKLSLCLSPDCTLAIEVWVVWHRTIEGLNIYGIYFSKIKDADKEKIYQFIRRDYPKQVYKQWWQSVSATKGGEKMEDRRIFERLAVKLKLKFINLRENREGDAQTQEISAKGLGVITNQQLLPQTPLEMWLEIPDHGQPLYTRGEVAWSKLIQPNEYRVGVNLERADLMGLSRITRML